MTVQPRPELDGQLWTTPADLAEIALAVRRAVLRQPGSLLPAELAAQMLTDQVGAGYGLGTVLDERGPLYGHLGDSVGYRALSVAHQPSGSGLVVLTNGDSGMDIIGQVLEILTEEHPAPQWASGAASWMGATIGRGSSPSTSSA